MVFHIFANGEGLVHSTMAATAVLVAVVRFVIESGEVTYTSQYRIHIENTMISHRTDTHTFTTFESTKRRTDQNSKQKIETHILGVS